MKNHKSSSLEQVAHVYLIWHKNHLSKNALGWDGQFYHVNVVWASLWNETKFRNESHSGIKINQGRPRGVVVYQYTRKKFAKIPKIRPNNTPNYTQVYFIPEIQRKWYTEYPYLSCNIPYTWFKKPLYTVYPKTLADPD